VNDILGLVCIMYEYRTSYNGFPEDTRDWDLVYSTIVNSFVRFWAYTSLYRSQILTCQLGHRLVESASLPHEFVNV
jgi:hypothetical protein